jgi:hypothetical protein
MATATPKPMVQDGHEYREMTDAEYAQYEIDQAAAQTQAAAQAAQAAARQAVLDKLGLTQDEAQALLG